MKRKIELLEALDYELHSSWWCGLISNGYLQDLSARYFTWKVKRKYKRYADSKKHEAYYKLFKGL